MRSPAASLRGPSACLRHVHGKHRQPYEVGAEGDALIKPDPRRWFPSATSGGPVTNTFNVTTAAPLINELSGNRLPSAAAHPMYTSADIGLQGVAKR
jgi:hypothetical protein